MRNALICALLATAAFPLARAAAADSPHSQAVVIKRPLQVPGDTLQPGSYLFTLEDKLNDHAIVRVSGGPAGGINHLLLAVPGVHLSKAGPNGLVVLTGEKTQVLRGWVCSLCSDSFEFVYMKNEAAQLVAETGHSILAADPVYDKMPPQLTAEDMKVVTLWLLSPERVSGDRGVGLKAVKYVSSAAPPPSEMASAATGRKHLPATGSPIGTFAALAFLLFGASLLLRVIRLKRFNAHLIP